MTKTITAIIPARSQRGDRGQVFAWPASTRVFEQDEAGTWYAVCDDERYACTEEDVIEDCRGATNWKDIRDVHFRMYGFHG
jgi:hypothetical protein